MGSRRQFLQQAVGLGAWSLSAGALAGGSNQRERRRRRRQASKLIRPQRLRKGDRVGLIAPASNAWEDEDIRFASDVLASLGFEVKHGDHLFKRHGYLAGRDEQRADDVNAMFADESVQGIFALRGGYGTPRILPFLDYHLIAKNPKVLMGYSDITALLHAIHVKTGLVTFHGPIAKQVFKPYTLAEFKRVLMEPQAGIVLGSPPPFEASEGMVEYENRLTRIVGGKASGPLIGGNLSLMTKLLGTPYSPDYRGKILVLEDVGEEPYRVDGMLTHLWLAGKLQQLAGIVFGKFTDAMPDGNSFSMEEVLRHRCEPLGIPVLRGLMVGHVSRQTTLPIGAEVALDVDAGTLTLHEAAVL